MTSMVPVDWTSACIVPSCKGKGDNYESTSFKGIRLLSIVNKLHGKVLIKSIREGTEDFM